MLIFFLYHSFSYKISYY